MPQDQDHHPAALGEITNTKPHEVNTMNQRYQTQSRQLPSKPDSERAIIATAMADRGGRIHAQRLLSTSDFYIPANRILWGYIGELGNDCDPLTLQSKLNGTSDLDRVGGAIAIGELITLGATPDHLEFHAKEIVDAAKLRGVIEGGLAMVEQAYDSADSDRDADEIVAGGMMALGALSAGKGDATDIRKSVLAAIDHLEDVMAGKVKPGIVTRWPSLNEVVPLSKSSVITIAGGTSSGKSIIAANMSVDVLNAGGRVLFFSFEMTEQDMIYRILSDKADIPPEKFFMADRHKMTPGEMARLTAAVEWLAGTGLTIYDDATLGIERIAAIVRAECAERPVDLVVCDYLQLVPPTVANAPREQQVAHTSRMLRQIGMETGAVVCSLSQLNDNGEVRESRAIKQDAVILLQISDDDGGLVVRKNRNGQRGITLPIAQRHGRMEFTER